MITEEEMQEIDAAILKEKTRADKAEARIRELEAEILRLSTGLTANREVDHD